MNSLPSPGSALAAVLQGPDSLTVESETPTIENALGTKPNTLSKPNQADPPNNRITVGKQRNASL